MRRNQNGSSQETGNQPAGFAQLFDGAGAVYWQTAIQGQKAKGSKRLEQGQGSDRRGDEVREKVSAQEKGTVPAEGQEEEGSHAGREKDSGG